MEVGNFRGFRVFDFSPYTKIKNSEIFSRRKFQGICFLLRIWEFPSFLSFWFQYKNQNRKLGNFGNFLLFQIKISSEIYKSWKCFRVFGVFNFRKRAKIKKLETSKIPNFSQIKEIHSNFKFLKKFVGFARFWFQYTGQNRKHENLGNFQLFQIKEIPWNLKVLRILPNFPTFLFQYNTKIENSESSEISNSVFRSPFLLALFLALMGWHRISKEVFISSFEC